MTDIPEDVMKAARSAATTRLFSDRADKQADELTRHIARAILSERESATKAERERCAERFEIAATELGRQECCGFATSDHECCADPLYMISDRDGARAIRKGTTP